MDSTRRQELLGSFGTKEEVRSSANKYARRSEKPFKADAMVLLRTVERNLQAVG
jgi:hypothetical protein